MCAGAVGNNHPQVSETPSYVLVSALKQSGLTIFGMVNDVSMTIAPDLMNVMNACICAAALD